MRAFPQPGGIRLQWREQPFARQRRIDVLDQQLRETAEALNALLKQRGNPHPMASFWANLR